MPRGPRNKNIIPATRVAVALFLSGCVTGASLPETASSAAMMKFSIERTSVRRIWRARLQPDVLIAPHPPRKRTTKRTLDDVAKAIEAVTLSERQTLRALSAATKIPLATLARYLASSMFRRYICRVKPTLTAEHKMKRLVFALSHVQRPFGSALCFFKSMYDVVHVDEKWFNLYKTSTRFYLSPNEPLPYRSTPNKRYIGKVMFLAAIARPRYDHHLKRHFDGKIGIWPIIEIVPAKRSSANRPAGTSVVQNVSMTREVYVRMLKEQVFPAIKMHFSWRKNRVIKVQQDNAGPHIAEDDASIAAAGHDDGWEIKVVCQPLRSPDLNVLDLGLFNSMQSLQYQRESHTAEALIDAVKGAFNSVPVDTIDRTFLTLQRVMESVIVHEGDNDFPVPRSRKHFRRGIIPSSMSISADVVLKEIHALKNMDN